MIIFPEVHAATQALFSNTFPNEEQRVHSLLSTAFPAEHDVKQAPLSKTFPIDEHNVQPFLSVLTRAAPVGQPEPATQAPLYE